MRTRRIDMRYNSLDHFLKEHEAEIAAIIMDVQRRVGGHYARLAPEELQQNAAQDAQYVMQIWRKGLADREAREIATHADRAGIDLNDLIRLVDEMAVSFAAFFEEELREQPELREDLLRRMRHTSASYRTSIIAVRLDKKLSQFQTTL